jgi:hypothetical protein
VVLAEHGPHQPAPLYGAAGQTALASELGGEEQRSVLSEPRRSPAAAPREPPPASAQQADGWIETYWRNEARWLSVRVEELERQLRQRTLVLSSGLALMTGAAAGAILFSLSPFQSRPQITAAVPTVVAAALPRAPPAPVQAAKQAALPEPVVRPPPPEQTSSHNGYRAEPAPAPPAPEHDAAEPAALLTERADVQPVPTAETRALPALPPMRANNHAETAEIPALRAVLSDIKQQMQVYPEIGGTEATSSMPPSP